jgi:hypothetical protein
MYAGRAYPFTAINSQTLPNRGIPTMAAIQTTLTDGEMIAMATLAAAGHAETSADYFILWQELCGRLQQNKIVSAARINEGEDQRRLRISQLEFRLEESSAVIRAMSKWTRCEHCEEK